MVCPFGGMQHYRFGASHVPFWGILTFGKKLLPKSGHTMAQNGPKWPKMAQNCIIIHADVPFLDILIFNLNVLLFGGDAILSHLFCTQCESQKTRHHICSQKNEKISLPNLANIIILLSFCYHLDTWVHLHSTSWHHLSCDAHRLQKSLVEIWQILSFWYHCY